MTFLFIQRSYCFIQKQGCPEQKQYPARKDFNAHALTYYGQNLAHPALAETDNFYSSTVCFYRSDDWS